MFILPPARTKSSRFTKEIETFGTTLVTYHAVQQWNYNRRDGCREAGQPPFLGPRSEKLSGVNGEVKLALPLTNQRIRLRLT